MSDTIPDTLPNLNVRYPDFSTSGYMIGRGPDCNHYNPGRSLYRGIGLLGIPL